MKRNILILMLTLASAASYSQSKARKVDAMLKEIMLKEHIPGLAYAVLKDGKVEASGVMGKASIPFNVDVTRQTVFQLASCSKIYTALLLGELFDANIIQPETKLSAVFDSIPDSWKDITIIQLASHQAGIKVGDFSKAQNSKDAFAIAKQMPLEFAPGEKSSYVSSDYWILLHLIEKVTQMKYYDALKKFVLVPLRLNSTYVNYPKIGYFTDLDIVPNQAQEYHWFKEDSTLRINQMWFREPDYAAGGIYSSIHDLTIVAQEIQKGDFISATTRRLISNPVKLNSGADGSFGLAMIIRPYEGHKIIEHSGGPALADFVYFEKEGYTFIVLTNNRGVYPYITKAIATLFIEGLPYPEVPKEWQ